ncbi:metallophosphoesterase [Paenibacillus sp. JSM ZJ436]|uniref:metallophosphoesterase n=1 Tax=Paenibacillus sp. JSM ZJ436 TaxID=3376190 RepID=UPI0037AFB169
MSDIHGCCDEFNALLRKIAYKPDQDKLILLGDYVDRGMKSRQVVEQVKSLHEEWGVIVLKGNHDDMMAKALTNDNESMDSDWLNNGAYQTIESYCGFDFFEQQFEWDTYLEAKEFIRKHYKHHIDFLSDLQLYHESESHIFVHAGVNPLYSDWKKTSEDDFIWIREIFYNFKTELNKKVVFGHTPCIYLHETEDVWFSPLGDKIGVDGGCAFGLQLNALLVNSDGSYETAYVNKGDT